MLCHIEIEKTETWPEEFLFILQENKQLLISFYQEDYKIYLQQDDDVILRINPPENPYEVRYSEIVSTLAGILEIENIIGYHCTRLTSSEITGIIDAGMRTLTPDLVRDRLSLALKEGHLTQEQHDYIVNCEELKCSLNNEYGYRTGQICFCPNKSSLTDSGGISRLLRSWGGEAVYNGHEHNEESLIFRSIGTPCIIKASIPIRDICKNSISLAKIFISQFITDYLDFSPDPSPGFDMFVKRDLRPDEIIKIIKFYDEEFEKLTESSSWDGDEALP